MVLDHGSLQLGKDMRKRVQIWGHICLFYFSWVFLYGFSTICLRQLQIMDLILVRLEEVDGAEAGEEVTIHRLRTRAHRLILERGIRLGLTLAFKDGGQDSGLEL